jgi:hypothetical protein
MYLLLAMALNPPIEGTLVNSALAANGGGMSCVAEHCSEKLSKCLSDGNCSRGMGCFVKCAAIDSIGYTAENEQGLCQARCMDLHESSVMNEFAHCAMAQYKCIDPLPADLRCVFIISHILTICFRNHSLFFISLPDSQVSTTSNRL